MRILGIDPGYAIVGYGAVEARQGRYRLHAVDNTHLLHANVPQLRRDQALDAAALAQDILKNRKAVNA